MGAHAYYVHKHVTQHLEGGSLKGTWRFLTAINMGSLYMREKTEKARRKDDEVPFPTPREIGKVIRCFNEWGNIRKAMETYSFLSEFSHPNMGAFSHYYEMKRDEWKTVWVRYFDPPRDALAAPLPDVSISLVATLHFVLKLLVKTSEIDVAPQVKSILIEYAELHPSSSSES